LHSLFSRISEFFLPFPPQALEPFLWPEHIPPHRRILPRLHPPSRNKFLSPIFIFFDYFRKVKTTPDSFCRLATPLLIVDQLPPPHILVMGSFLGLTSPKFPSAPLTIFTPLLPPGEHALPFILFIELGSDRSRSFETGHSDFFV